MNERYEEARMDVVDFRVMDVITTSDPFWEENYSTTQEWNPREDEGGPDYNAFVDL